MLQYEKELFEVITQKLEETTKIINNMINGQQEKKLQKQLVRFSKDVESFLDLEGKTLGPFKKVEIANMPAEITNILISGDKAVAIEND
jgi:hypothetical protein